MDLCDRCDIEEKIFVCCGRFPSDQTQAIRQRAGRQVHCCPHLNLSGKCGIYDQRPTECRTFWCERYHRWQACRENSFKWMRRLLQAGDNPETE